MRGITVLRAMFVFCAVVAVAVGAVLSVNTQKMEPLTETLGGVAVCGLLSAMFGFWDD